MKKVIAVVLTMALALMLMANFACAAQKVTKAEVIANVEKAVAYWKKNGQAKAFAEFNNLEKGIFTSKNKELYISVFDFTGKCLAHGTSPSLIGRDTSQVKDATGKLMVMEFINVAKTKGKGWVEYQWTNPNTKKIGDKLGYIMRFGNQNMLICCGMYK